MFVDAYAQTKDRHASQESVKLFLDDVTDKKFNGVKGKQQDPTSVFEFLMKSIEVYLKRKQEEYKKKEEEGTEDPSLELAKIQWQNPFIMNTVTLNNTGEKRNFYCFVVDTILKMFTLENHMLHNLTKIEDEGDDLVYLSVNLPQKHKGDLSKSSDQESNLFQRIGKTFKGMILFSEGNSKSC